MEDDWFLCERDQDAPASSAVSVSSKASNLTTSASLKKPDLTDFTIVNFSLDEVEPRRTVPDVIVEDLVPLKVEASVPSKATEVQQPKQQSSTTSTNNSVDNNNTTNNNNHAEVEALRERLRETEIKLRHSEALRVVAQKQRERAEERARNAENRVAVVERRLAEAIRHKEIATAHKLAWAVQRKEARSPSKRKQLALKQSEAQQQASSRTSKRDVWVKSNHRTACSAMRKI